MIDDIGRPPPARADGLLSVGIGVNWAIAAESSADRRLAPLPVANKNFLVTIVVNCEGPD